MKDCKALPYLLILFFNIIQGSDSPSPKGAGAPTEPQSFRPSSLARPAETPSPRATPPQAETPTSPWSWFAGAVNTIRAKSAEAWEGISAQSADLAARIGTASTSLLESGRQVMGEQKADVELEMALKQGTSSWYPNFTQLTPTEKATAFIRAYADLTAKLERKSGTIFYGPNEEKLRERLDRSMYLQKQASDFVDDPNVLTTIKQDYEAKRRLLIAVSTEINEKLTTLRCNLSAKGKLIYNTILTTGDDYHPASPPEHTLNMMSIILYLYTVAESTGINFEEGTFKVYDPNQRLYNQMILPPACPRAASHGRQYDHNGTRQTTKFFGLNADADYLLPHDKTTMLIWYDPEFHFTYIKPENYPVSGFVPLIMHGIEYAAAIGVKFSTDTLITQARMDLRVNPSALPPQDAAIDDDKQYRKERVPLYVVNAWIYFAIQGLQLTNDAEIKLIAERGIWDMILKIDKWLNTVKTITSHQKELLIKFVEAVNRAINPQKSVYGRLGREVDGPIVTGESFDRVEESWRKILKFVEIETLPISTDHHDDGGPAASAAAI